MLALGLSACGSGGGGASGGGSAAPEGGITGQITFQTWSLTPKFQGYLDGVIAAFEAEHPGTSVKLMDQPGDGYSEKVLTQASSNTLPDVVNLPPDFALPLAQADKLIDVSAADPDLRSTFVPGAIAAYEFEGVDGVFGYPWYLNTDIYYWNTKLFSECGLDPNKLPTTTDELFAQAEVYSSKCTDTYLLSRAPGIDDFTRAGVPIMSEDGNKFVFNTPEAAAVLKKYVDAYQKKLMPSSVLNDDYLGNSKLFTQGKVAWTTGGAPAYDSFVNDNPSLAGNVEVSKAVGTPPCTSRA